MQLASTLVAFSIRLLTFTDLSRLQKKTVLSNLIIVASYTYKYSHMCVALVA